MSVYSLKELKKLHAIRTGITIEGIFIDTLIFFSPCNNYL